MAVGSACSAPAQIRDLSAAEEHERSGQVEEALRSYRAAQKSCTKLSNSRRRKSSCASAHLQYAQLLASEKRLEEAIAAYQDAEAILTTRPDQAQACYAAALAYWELGQDKQAYQYLWRTLTFYPEQQFAADALKYLLRDGRERAPEDLRAQLSALSNSLAGSKVADNLLVALAELEENEFHAPRKALAYYDELVAQHRSSGFYDDALWHGARLSHELGDDKGAVSRLRTLLSTREVAIGAGSYFSVWLDDAQLRLGVLLRDGVGDKEAAIRAFAKLPSDYPASILRDDALYERAVTKSQLGRTEDACKDLAKLQHKYADSKYELEKAPKLRLQLHCAL